MISRELAHKLIYGLEATNIGALLSSHLTIRFHKFYAPLRASLFWETTKLGGKVALNMVSYSADKGLSHKSSSNDVKAIKKAIENNVIVLPFSLDDIANTVYDNANNIPDGVCCIIDIDSTTAYDRLLLGFEFKVGMKLIEEREICITLNKNGEVSYYYTSKVADTSVTDVERGTIQDLDRIAEIALDKLQNFIPSLKLFS